MLILLLINFHGVQIYRVVKIPCQYNKILNRLSRIFEISNNCTPNSGPFVWQYGLVLLLPLQLYVLPFKSLHWLQQTVKVIVKLWSVSFYKFKCYSLVVLLHKYCHVPLFKFCYHRVTLCAAQTAPTMFQKLALVDRFVKIIYHRLFQNLLRRKR